MQSGTQNLTTAAALTFAAIIGPMLLLTALHLIGKLHKKRAHFQRSPRSVSTPLGYIPMWDADTLEMYTQGLRRARSRQYCNPRGER